jgi:hypothetical protein
MVDMHDIETFLAAQPKNRPRRLQIARQFFRFAKTNKMTLIDPTSGLSAKAAKGFIGQALTPDQQRRLFQRWITDPAVHPHEALLGILALLHGASSAEVRHLHLDDIGSCQPRHPSWATPPPRTPGSSQLEHRAAVCGAPRDPAHQEPSSDGHTMDAKLVAAAFGMHPEGVMIYLADHVDEGRLTAQPEQG